MITTAFVADVSFPRNYGDYVISSNVSTSVFLVWCRVGFVVNFCLILAVHGLEQASECSC